MARPVDSALRGIAGVLLMLTVSAGAAITEIGPSGDLRSAAGALGAGDTLVLRGGHYRVETVRITAQGTPDQWVAIMAKSGETPVLTSISSSHNLISIRSAAYVEIAGLVVDTTPEGVDPLKFEAGHTSHHVTIRDCEIRNYRGVGINSKGNDHHIVVRRCHIHHSIGGHGEGFY
ncbi:MAG: hypothetical protein GF331_18885, partial [Chitinivibrionales bacterium]|nr:hypothetical protein [Chitinivibrionales bacterium]